MRSQITMKDMASHFGVSLNTIHKAINGKPGVGEATRRMILEYARENGYKLNAMAASLKRKTVHIAVCLPELDADSRYFYGYIWQGYRTYKEEWGDLHLQMEEIAYRKDNLTGTLLKLYRAWKKGEHPEGLLTSPPTDKTGVDAINAMADLGICVVFVTGDNPACQRLGAVYGDYDTAGKIMAEQIMNMLGKNRKILLLAGNPEKDSHSIMVNGFRGYLDTFDSECQLRILFGYGSEERLEEQIAMVLKEDMPDGVACVFARGSAKLYHVLKEMPGKKIPVIANDIFEENVTALKEGLFSNLVFKDPHKQAYLAMKMLCEYLIRDVKPEEAVQKVESVLVFQSNLCYYWK